ncbi:hypothetical protein KAR91_75140 [Candidatus Pacearchaeota archaeon]|nr:hypothetical protein [Candidatus Pacearchaeota archaeon]
MREIAEDINIAFDERMDQLIKAGTFVFKDKLYRIEAYHPIIAMTYTDDEVI